MILDELLEFCDATSVARAAGTALIGDVIDLGATARDIGNGEPLYLYISVDTSVVTGGSAGTVQFKLASDSAAAIATDGSATEHLATPAYVTDDDSTIQLTAGKAIYVAALPTGVTYERYLGILQVTATTTITAGAVSIGLTKDPTGWRAYPEGTN